VTELSVIVPTLHERGNIHELVKRLSGVLVGVAWEVIFVDDDSHDGTANAVPELAQKDGHVRCVQRHPVRQSPRYRVQSIRQPPLDD
jgi:dolichol-phosphate mannosyltransferase